MIALTIVGRKDTETRAHTIYEDSVVTLVTDDRDESKLTAIGLEWPDRQSAEEQFIELAETMDEFGYVTEAPVERTLEPWGANAIRLICQKKTAATRLSPKIRQMLLAA